MNWKDFYGAYIEYYNHGIYDYRAVIVDDWHKVMVELDSFVKDSTNLFLEGFDERIYWSMEGNLDDCFKEFDYLNEDMHPCHAIRLVIENEIERSSYEYGTPYTSRRYYQFVRWALEDVWNEEDSWFAIHFEGPLSEFVTKWHQYVMDSCRIYPQILQDKSKSLFRQKRIYPESYELLGKLSLFLDVDEKRFPEAIRGFFNLVEDYNDKQR